MRSNITIIGFSDGMILVEYVLGKVRVSGAATMQGQGCGALLQARDGNANTNVRGQK